MVNDTVVSSFSASSPPPSQLVARSPRSLSLDFVPVQNYEAMKARYNVVYQQDMLQVGKCDYDGVETWIDAVRPLMKQPPWGQIEVAGACLQEIKEVGRLAQVDATRLERAMRNSIYIPSLISRIDRRITEHREREDAKLSSTTTSRSFHWTTSEYGDVPLIFCRTNECSMKHSTSYKVRPFRNGADIMDQLLRDRRLISWLSMDKCNITSTTLYLSDFDTSFQSKNEYRVFIWKGRVTGISQYRWFETPETEYHTEQDALRICADIVEFIEGADGLINHLRAERRNKKNKVLMRMRTEISAAEAAETNEAVNVAEHVGHDDKDDHEIVLVADVVHTHGTVYLVEINLFGGETGCGSSLFHWKRDEHILYSDGQQVVCRFLSRA